MTTITNKTNYFGVLGFPVAHSLSPFLFNRLFKYYNYDGVYRFIKQQNTKAAIEAIKILDLRGVSVTIPHKNEAIKYMDWVDPLAQKINCINTIFNDNGVLKGYNYDGYGAIEGLQKVEPLWPKKKILIIGNGGAAQGIAMSMVMIKKIKSLTFLIRDQNKFNPLKKQIEQCGGGCDAIVYSKDRPIPNSIIKHKFDIIINTTPVGMHPHIDNSPLPKGLLPRDGIVYDIVYNPLETKLILEAKKIGAKIILGNEMFIGQAYLQLKCWTGIEADKTLMASLLLKNK